MHWVAERRACVMSEPTKPERWRKRAAELRVIATTMTDRTAKASLLKSAREWERMADEAEKSEKSD